MVFSSCEDVAKDRNTRGTSSMDSWGIIRGLYDYDY